MTDLERLNESINGLTRVLLEVRLDIQHSRFDNLFNELDRSTLARLLRRVERTSMRIKILDSSTA